MKKVLLLLLTLPFFALNAQIFINTNPNAKAKIGSTTTTKKVETKTELKSTNTVTKPVTTTTTTRSTRSTRSTRPTRPTRPNNTGGIKVSSTNNNTGGVKVSSTKTSTSTNGGGIKVSSTKTSTNTGGGIKVSSTNASSSTRTTSVSDKRVGGSSSNSRTASATSGSDVPPNAQAGKCYARCSTEDQYSFQTKQVVNSPKMIKKIKLPALYTTIYDTVIVRNASTRTEKIPAQYETIKQQKMISPATTKWVKGKADAGCLSANPKDCQVMCLVEVPAQYKTITKKVLKNNGYSRAITIPMEYKVVAKKIKTQNESFTEQVIPATYKTVQERVLVKKGGYKGWREILCGSDLTSSKISQIQKALKAAGFNPGPIDNVLGSKTKEALKAYQRAKGLPVGNLNLDTLKSLGIK